MAANRLNRRSFLVGALLVSAATVLPIIPTPAFAFSSSGNPVSDLVYAVNRNRGMAHGLASQLALAAGAQTAGTSMWQRILGRTPLKRLFWVANLATVAYWIYSEAQGTFTENLPAQEDVNNTQFRPVGTNLQSVTVTSLNEYHEVRRAMEPNTAIVVIRAYLPGSPRSLEFCRLTRYIHHPTLGYFGEHFVEVKPYSGGVPYGFNGRRWNDVEATAFATDDVIIDGVRFFRGYGSYRDGWVNGEPLWRWVNSVPASAPDNRPKPVFPDTIPAHADVNPERIAEDAEEAVKRARQADPSLPATDPITPAEIEAVAPSGTPVRQVGPAKLPGQTPQPIPDPDAPSPGGGDGGSGGEPNWSTPPRSVAMPGDVGMPNLPSPGPIDDRQGVAVCPALPGGITSHCEPLNSARPFLVNMGRLAGSVASLMMILRD